MLQDHAKAGDQLDMVVHRVRAMDTIEGRGARGIVRRILLDAVVLLQGLLIFRRT